MQRFLGTLHIEKHFGPSPTVLNKSSSWIKLLSNTSPPLLNGQGKQLQNYASKFRNRSTRAFHVVTCNETHFTLESSLTCIYDAAHIKTDFVQSSSKECKSYLLKISVFKARKVWKYNLKQLT